MLALAPWEEGVRGGRAVKDVSARHGLGKWIERVTFIDFLWRESILMPVSQPRMDRKTSCALLIREKDAQGLSTGTRP